MAARFVNVDLDLDALLQAVSRIEEGPAGNMAVLVFEQNNGEDTAEVMVRPPSGGIILQAWREMQAQEVQWKQERDEREIETIKRAIDAAQSGLCPEMAGTRSFGNVHSVDQAAALLIAHLEKMIYPKPESTDQRRYPVIGFVAIDRPAYGHDVALPADLRLISLEGWNKELTLRSTAPHTFLMSVDNARDLYWKIVQWAYARPEEGLSIQIGSPMYRGGDALAFPLENE